MLSYFRSVAAIRIVAPRPASTRNHLSPATTTVAAPACAGSGRGKPVPMRITSIAAVRIALSNECVIHDLRPRLHRLAQRTESATRQPLAGHLLRFAHRDVAPRRPQQIDDAEVHAADGGGFVVDDAGELKVVVVGGGGLLVKLLTE